MVARPRGMFVLPPRRWVGEHTLGGWPFTAAGPIGRADYRTRSRMHHHCHGPAHGPPAAVMGLPDALQRRNPARFRRLRSWDHWTRLQVESRLRSRGKPEHSMVHAARFQGLDTWCGLFTSTDANSSGRPPLFDGARGVAPASPRPEPAIGWQSESRRKDRSTRDSRRSAVVPLLASPPALPRLFWK